jgi:hypothetical protein
MDGRIKEYERLALDCLKLAEDTTEIGARIALLSMARAWRKLALQVEKAAQKKAPSEEEGVRRAG